MELKNQKIVKHGNGYAFTIRRTYISDGIIKLDKKYNLSIKEAEKCKQEQ